MTVEEMNDVIQHYCGNYDDDCGCCAIGHLCLPIEGCFDRHEDVCKEAYEVVLKLNKTPPEHDGCKGCKHDQKEVDELPCSHCRYTLLSVSPLYQVCPDLYEPEVIANPYWERINAIAEQQRTKGMSKYGVGLESNPAAIMERINHLQEELIDGLMYCEWIKDHLKELEG